MTSLEEIFNKVTVNGNREMTLDRFKEAAKEAQKEVVQSFEDWLSPIINDPRRVDVFIEDLKKEIENQ